MGRGLLVWLLLTATASAQSTVPVRLGWDLDATHEGSIRWEAEVDGVTQSCDDVQVSATYRSCVTQVTLGSHAFRVRGVAVGGEAEVIGEWSAAVTDTVAVPGAFVIVSAHADAQTEPEPEPMAASLLTSWDGTPSGSITPTANRLVLVVVGLYSAGSDPTRPTSVTGNGITYGFVAESGVFGDATNRKRIALYAGMSASPSAGAITLSGGSANFRSSVAFELDTGGTSAADAIVQSAVNQTNAATSITATLAAFADAANYTVSTAYIMGFASAAYTPGSGFTEIYDGFSPDRPQVQWKESADTTADVSWTGTDAAGIIAIEVKKVGGGGGTNHELEAEAGSVAITGQNATLRAARRLVAAGGSVSISGQAASLEYGRKVSAASGSFSLSGQAAALRFGRRVSALGGSFAIAGQDATFALTRRLDAQAGSVSLTGQDVTFLRGRLFSAESGSVNLNGQAASLLYGRLFSAESGDVTITGQDVTLMYGSEIVLTAESGTISLAGQDASLRVGRRLLMVGGSWSLAGQSAALLFHRRVVSDVGVFALNGQDATLRTTRRISAEGGSVTLTGQDAELFGGQRMVADAGLFAITGIAANLRAARQLSALGGTVTLTGVAATLTWSGELIIHPDPLVVTVTADETVITVGAESVTVITV